MNWIRVAIFSSRAKAVPIQQRLAQAGLTAEVHDQLHLERLWFVSKTTAGARLEVPAAQLERAVNLLKDLDGALNDAVRCPECGSLSVDYPQFAHTSILPNLAIGLIAGLGLLEKQYYCVHCHFMWPKDGVRPRRNRSHLAPYYFIEGVEQTTLPEPFRRQPPPP